MRPYMYKAYQSSFNFEKYFIFLKTTLLFLFCQSLSAREPCIKSGYPTEMGFTQIYVLIAVDLLFYHQELTCHLHAGCTGFPFINR